MKSSASELGLSLQKKKEFHKPVWGPYRKEDHSHLYIFYVFITFFKKVSIMFVGYRNNRFFTIQIIVLVLLFKG